MTNYPNSKSLLQLGLSEDQLEELIGKYYLSGLAGKISFTSSETLGDLVIKVGHSRESYDALREYAALRFLDKTYPGVAPKPYYLDKKRNLLIMEKIDGYSPLNIDSSIISSIANRLTKIHSYNFDWTGQIHILKRDRMTNFDRAKNQVNFANGWFKKILPYVAREDKYLAESLEHGRDMIVKQVRDNERAFSEQGFALIHYDINRGNMILNDKQELVLIDWGQPYIADPGMDIGKFFLKCDINSDQQEEFFRNYSLVNVSAKNLRARASVYYSISRLISYCWRVNVMNGEINTGGPVANHLNRDLFIKRLKQDREFIIEFSKCAGERQ